MAAGLTTPVAFIIFNRPEQTREVFDAIRAARPEQLFVIADGPRAHVATDRKNCAAARAVFDLIDWPCQVVRHFADANLGLRKNISHGLDIVFQQSESAIILEDDCLPDPTFFAFCQELLQRYAQDRHVGTVSGTNLDPAQHVPPNDESYYFSQYCHIWGWATWRRVWQMCDRAMTEWRSLRRTGWLNSKFETASAANFWRRYLDEGGNENRDALQAWDAPLIFALWKHEMLSIVPRTNLVRNLGFGASATHTKQHRASTPMSVAPMSFPLRHPLTSTANAEFDRRIQTNWFESGSPWQKLYWRLRLPLPIWLVRRVLRWLGR